MARFRPTARVSATMGVEQNSPSFTPGVANAARSLATARSHEHTNWQPALHGGNHRLRNRLQPLHQCAANGEQLPVVRLLAAG
jgi:hypothetical protein